MILNQLLIIPMIGAILIAMIPVKSPQGLISLNKKISSEKEDLLKTETTNNVTTIKKIALITSIINFILSLYL